LSRGGEGKKQKHNHYQTQAQQAPWCPGRVLRWTNPEPTRDAQGQLKHANSLNTKLPTSQLCDFLVGSNFLEANGGAANGSPPIILKVKPRLQLDGSGSERILSLTEVSIHDVILKVSEIELVK